jgi:hypothetical protein
MNPQTLVSGPLVMLEGFVALLEQLGKVKMKVNASKA